MGSLAQAVSILVAEDDPDDRMLIKEAFDEARLINHVSFVGDGAELMERLRRTGRYSGLPNSSLPGLVLLDLNLPKLDGREALKEIKEDSDLRRIPVVVLTTSSAEEDILCTYNLGVNSFIVKPVTYEGLIKIMRTLNEYWLQIVELPGNGCNH